ncbi:MAG: histidine--tRNA ligase [Phycisphaerales bacterium]|nr:histidine--tRNA ligase [Phycisphaerales bacterium]
MGYNPPMASKHAFQAPKGTRDFFPEDMAVRRHLERIWRDVSIRHGFDEIEGPTFEHLELYTAKSGEGIVSELFSFRRAGGDTDYALRPEFTPTLARMVAARAAQLPKPTKWFTAGPFFRAERPQRGRLREFLQWNVDFIGLPGFEDASTSDDFARITSRADSECVACCVDLLRSTGLASADVKIRVSYRPMVVALLDETGASGHAREAAMQLLDRRSKLPAERMAEAASELGWNIDRFDELVNQQTSAIIRGNQFYKNAGYEIDLSIVSELQRRFEELGCVDWIEWDLSIVRGLAYYTGMVFEVIADGERAVAGGGRYDNLIELFGGPPTPAVGFGMGDVVLTNLLRDKGLLPEGAALLESLSAPPASSRPDAFVFTADDALDPIVRRLVADLRRGTGHNPLHARHPYKATRNIGKLLKEAAAQHARVAVIIESDTTATLKPLDAGEQTQCALADAAAVIARLVSR